MSEQTSAPARHTISIDSRLVSVAATRPLWLIGLRDGLTAASGAIGGVQRCVGLRGTSREAVVQTDESCLPRQARPVGANAMSALAPANGGVAHTTSLVRRTPVRLSTCEHRGGDPAFLYTCDFPGASPICIGCPSDEGAIVTLVPLTLWRLVAGPAYRRPHIPLLSFLSFCVETIDSATSQGVVVALSL